MIKQISEYQLALMTPKDLNPSSVNNYVKKIEVSFENLCTSLEEAGVRDPRALTMFQFYSKIDYFESKRRQSPPPPHQRPRR